jgi:hypothetical protein
MDGLSILHQLMSVRGNIVISGTIKEKKCTKKIKKDIREN